MTLTVRFGNLEQPHHKDDIPNAKEKLSEMMDKLHKAGFERQENIRNGVNEGRFYHIFELPHVIEFGADGLLAAEIMMPYAKYMSYIQLVAPEEAQQ